jgi:hypothetical protein
MPFTYNGGRTPLESMQKAILDSGLWILGAAGHPQSTI